MRVVIDTNIWIHLLISKKLTFLEEIIARPDTELLFSEELLGELREVLTRQKFQKYFYQDEITEFLLLLESRYSLIEVDSPIDVCRDVKDNFLLALCIDGKADYLVTGDSDLLIIEKFQATQVLRLSEFIDKVAS